MKELIFLFLFFISFEANAQGQMLVEKTLPNTYTFESIDSALTQIAGAPEPFYTYWWEFGDGHYSTEKNSIHEYKKNGSFNVLVATTNNYDDGPARPTKKNRVENNYELSASLSANETYLTKNEILSINKNHNPKPNEEIIFVETYKNNSTNTQSGTLIFFYNQKDFEKDHFVLADYRNHYNENEIDVTKNILFEKLDKIENEENYSSEFVDENFYKTMIATSEKSNIQFEILSKIGNDENEIKYFNSIKSIKKEVIDGFETYKDAIAFEFDNLDPEAERNLFITLKATNSMLEDTNVSISVKSIFIPNDYKYSTQATHFMPIVTAHDPNKLIVNKSKTFRAFSKKNALEYEIKFQNVGKGPAEEVKLRFYNNADIDIKKIEILDYEPKCDFCKENCVGSYIDTIITKEYVEFYFHNVYLPGTKQTDLESRKASKGFVKFTLQTEKRVKQNNLTCRTEIYFDKEEPIKTNNSKTIFQKRLYFGVETGTNYLPISFPKLDLFLRGTMTLRVTNNWYYRAEIGMIYKPNTRNETNWSDTSYRNQKGYFDVLDGNQNVINRVDYDIKYAEKITQNRKIIKQQSLLFDIVPIEFRRDINQMISIGFGINTKINLLTNTYTNQFTETQTKTLESVKLDSIYSGQPSQGQNINYYLVKTKFIENNTTTETNESNTTYNFNVISGLFLDINIGKIYSIPYFGMRANIDYHFKNKIFNPAIQFYLGANF